MLALGSLFFGAGENNLLPALRRRDLICCCGAVTKFFRRKRPNFYRPDTPLGELLRGLPGAVLVWRTTNTEHLA